MNKRKLQRQILVFLIAPLLGIYLSIIGENFFGFSVNHGTVLAQSPYRPLDVAEIVYQRLPDLPLENQYIRQETGENDPKNTLISRLIRYHEYVKKRPTQFRLDWKLTLADYLGVNETIKPQSYPGYRQLTENPLEGDKKAIDSLTRSQRNQLVDVLVSIYTRPSR